MQVTPLPFEGLLKVQLDVHPDNRGFFVERYNRTRFQQHGLPVDYVQDNHSRSLPGVVRGLHYQVGQGKLVGVTRGQVWDVVVDLREDSATFGRFHAEELSDENGVLLWIPSGFAHGFCVTGHEPADVMYKVDMLWSARDEGGILWNDQDLGIPWPVEKPILSGKDAALPTFAEYRQAPRFAAAVR